MPTMPNSHVANVERFLVEGMAQEPALKDDKAFQRLLAIFQKYDAELISLDEEIGILRLNLRKAEEKQRYANEMFQKAFAGIQIVKLETAAEAEAFSG